MTGLDVLNHPLAGTPFGTALNLCLVLAACAWLLSVVTREYSWVDRLWSVCPPLYCVIVAAALDFGSARVNLMTALAVIWGARLTFNFARKGGYGRGGEDYRWAVVRDRLGPLPFGLLNLVFIAPGQMLIIWLFTAPIHQAWQWSEAPLNWLDFVAAAAFVSLLAVETVADEQMWSFQQARKKRQASGESGQARFLTTGLYARSRHPNYCGEMGLWCAFYLFAVAASGDWLHWGGLGCLALMLIFAGSIPLTEALSEAKYPEYRRYRATTPMLLPRLWKRVEGTDRDSPRSG